MDRHSMLAALAVTALLAVASLAPAGPKDLMQVPTTPEAFDKIVAQLKTEAEAFAKADDDKAPALSNTIKRVQYSEKSGPALANVLQARHSKELMENLYVAYQLVVPLKMAGNETILAVKPGLLKLLRAHCRYKPMPQWPAASLAALNPSPSLPPDQLMKKMEQVHELRRQKAAGERPIVKHNRTIHALESTLKRLLAMVGDPAADEELLRRLAVEERSNLGTYEDTLAAIKAEAGQMERARAKRLYQQLKDLAFRVGTRKYYLNPTRPNYSLTGNSAFESRPAYFAVSTLQVVNLLATTAKEPAVPIPDVKKFEEEQQKRRERGRR